MTELNQVYKCEICGNMVEVVHASGGQLVCCGKPMTLVTENSVEASTEKHIPVIERKDGEVLVQVGSVAHPMLEEHHIEWIELITENRVYRKYLKAGDEPKASFKLCNSVTTFTVREYCNLHGLWKA